MTTFSTGSRFPNIINIFYDFDTRAAHAPVTVGAFVVIFSVLFAAIDDGFLANTSPFVKDGQTVATGILLGESAAGIVDWG